MTGENGTKLQGGLAAEDTRHTIILTVPVSFHRPIRLDAKCFERRATGVIMPVQADFAACPYQRHHQAPCDIMRGI